MIIWKNTCGESWQDTIENGWEVSGKPGAFLFFIPKGALTHHLLKQELVALPLVGHVRSSQNVHRTFLQRWQAMPQVSIACADGRGVDKTSTP